MMDYRENAGYIITDSCHVGDSEFVLGVHLTAPQQFVTWKCSNRTDYDLSLIHISEPTRRS